jgi:MFS family permease
MRAAPCRTDARVRGAAQLRHRHRRLLGLHAHRRRAAHAGAAALFKLGYSPFTLAFLFLLYEAAGVLANLVGGWLATRYGIKRMLIVGLVTQITGFLMLSMLDPGWTAAMSVAWVVLAQGICGVAKDLTKTASKSAIKIKLTKRRTRATASVPLGRLVHRQQERHERLRLLPRRRAAAGARLPAALWAMAGLLALVLAGVVLSLPPLMGKAKASKSAKELFAKNRGINLLALAARVALFGARDVWFVVGVPVFLYSQWLDLHHGGRLPRGLDHRLRHGAGARPPWSGAARTGFRPKCRPRAGGR